ncbi:MAG: hypothetical protein QXS20_01345 [Candidatus Thorarchaeota archaeon]
MAFPWSLTYSVAAVLSFGILLVSLVQYTLAVGSKRRALKPSTVRALAFFGISSLMVGLMAITLVFAEGTIVQRLWISIYLIFIINCEVQVATEDRRAHLLVYAIAVFSALGAIYAVSISPTEVSPILMTALTISSVVSLLLSVYLLRAAPSPFTNGVFLLNLTFLGLWYLIASGPLLTEILLYLKFFLIFLPVIVVSSMMGSLLKTWRRSVSLFALFLVLLPTVSISIVAVLVGGISLWQVWTFSIVALLVSIVAVGSLEPLLGHISPSTKVPLYLSVSLIVICGLSAFQSLMWTAIVAGEMPRSTVGGEYLLYVEWLIGTVGVAAFILSSTRPLFSPMTFSIFRLSIIGLSSSQAVLALPALRYDSTWTAMRWDYEALYPVMIALLLVGTVGYLEIARRLARLGSFRAAVRFAAFSGACLLFGLTVLLIEPATTLIWLGCMGLSGLLLNRANPKVLAGGST